MTVWIKTKEELPKLEVPILAWYEGEPHIAVRMYWYDLEKECDSWIWYISSWFIEPQIEYWAHISDPELAWKNSN